MLEFHRHTSYSIYCLFIPVIVGMHTEDSDRHMSMADYGRFHLHCHTTLHAIKFALQLNLI